MAWHRILRVMALINIVQFWGLAPIKQLFRKLRMAQLFYTTNSEQANRIHNFIWGFTQTVTLVGRSESLSANNTTTTATRVEAKNR